MASVERIERHHCLKWVPEKLNNPWLRCRAYPGLCLHYSKRKDGAEVRKFYLLYYWLPGRPRYKLLGPVGHPAWTLEQAQDEVRTLRRLVQQAKLRGEEDPLGKRRKEPEKPMTLREAAEIYQRRVTKSDRVKDEDKGRWRNHILPLSLNGGSQTLGDLPLHKVEGNHIWLVREAMADKRVAFNRVLALLSHFFNQVRDWKLISPALIRQIDWQNPVAKVDKYPEQRRERVYKPAESVALAKAIRSLLAPDLDQWQDDKRGQALMRCRSLLALRILRRTGHRPDEIRRLEWSHIFWDSSFADLPRVKGDRSVRKGRILAFGPKSLADLRTLEQLSGGSRYCLPARYDLEQHLGKTGLRKAWKNVKELASETSGLGLAGDVSADLYAFRHTVINLHAEAGIDFADMVDFVGHSKQGMTHRYRHSNGPRLAEVAEMIESHLDAWVADDRLDSSPRVDLSVVEEKTL